MDSDSLEQRNLSVDDLVIPVELLDSSQVAMMIREADVVFSL